jgi:hypothetical protein
MAVAAVALGIGIAAAPAAAKTCKDEVVAKSRSTIKQSEAAREKRAQDNAIAKWNKIVRATHGWAYRFWLRAEDKKVECTGTPKSKTCTVAAKPCRLY